jgi:hypothetical protein
MVANRFHKKNLISVKVIFIGKKISVLLHSGDVSVCHSDEELVPVYREGI